MENPASLCLTLTHTKFLPEHGQFKLLNLLKLEESDLTRYEWHQKSQSFRLSWNEEEGIGLEFDRTQGVHA
ncbi:hypothetical protein M8013_21600 [Enterobacteriaceae bacterium H4N4]|uniref:Uncharacterized protein n=1 Tax=Silvania confinis TaxID=2926470 RepID=A0A9J6QSN5_9ENTR|nr:hypothetical protein [Silvania confinis]MCU6671325.1 hypothetical protein [Silvania confinis]